MVLNKRINLIFLRTDCYPCNAMLSRVLAMAQGLSVSVYVCLSVCHKSEFYLND